jgi:hypothetical protein
MTDPNNCANRKNTLIQRTLDYWDETRTGPKINWYIDRLLFDELEWATTCGPVKRRPCDVLVVLVGYSFEPLLQAICVYDPKEIIPIVNYAYGDAADARSRISGHVQAEKLRAAVARAKAADGTKNWLENETVFMDPPPNGSGLPATRQIGADSPVEVFAVLQSTIIPRLRDDPRLKVVVDITGAKKSMVAGAYLFASYANLPVSYVDFDHYDPNFGKPYGYSCRPGYINSPQDDFMINQWRHVYEHYENAAFGNARSMLEEIVKGMSGDAPPLDTLGQPNQRRGLFPPKDIAATERMRNVLEILDRWENGDLQALVREQVSHQLVDPAPGPGFWPDALVKLGPRWVDLKQSGSLLDRIDDFELGQGGFYHDAQVARLYAHDELEKVSRLIRNKHDYRSAFLRAVGLFDLLCKTRLMLLWLDDKLLVGPKQGRADLYWTRSQSETTREALDKYVARAADLNAILGTLLGRHAFEIRDRGKLPEDLARERHMLPEEGPVPALALDDFLDQLARPELDDRHARSELIANVRRRAVRQPSFELRRKNDAAPAFNDFWSEHSDKLRDTTRPVDANPLFQLRNKVIHFCLSVPVETAHVAFDAAQANLDEFENNWIPDSDAARQAPNRSAPDWKALCDTCGVSFLPPWTRPEPPDETVPARG